MKQNNTSGLEVAVKTMKNQSNKEMVGMILMSVLALGHAHLLSDMRKQKEKENDR